MKTTLLRKLFVTLVCLVSGLSVQAQFTATLEQHPADNWGDAPVSFVLSEVATALNSDAATLVSAYQSWTAEGSTEANMFFLTTPDGLSDDYTQGGKGGFWVNADGVPQAWSGDNSALRWYNTINMDLEGDAFVINIGQFPGQCAAGDVYKPKFVLKYGEKEVSFEVTISIMANPFVAPEPATLIEKELNVVGEAEVSVVQDIRSGYDSDKVYVKLSDLCEKLGIESPADVQDNLAQLLYTTWFNPETTDKKDSLTNKSTAGAPGFWYTDIRVGADKVATGECAAASYSQGDYFFMEAFAFNAENDTLSCNLGQYPNRMKGGEEFFAYIYIIYGDKAYRIRYNLSIPAREEGNGLEGYVKVGEAIAEVEQNPTKDYSTSTVRPDMEAIAAALGCEVADVEMKALDDMNSFAGSTANNGGFWFSFDGTVMGWGTGCALFVEPAAAGDFSRLNVGQFPDALTVGNEVSAYLYFMYDKNYYAYTVHLTITEPQEVNQDFESVATRSMTLQATVPDDYPVDGTVSIPVDIIESLVGTADPALYGLNIESVAEETGEVFSKSYSCDPKPGFWLNSDGRVSVWGDADARVGICYADGVFTFFSYPGRNSMGDVFKTTLFLVNEDTNKMITCNITLAFVESIETKEEVGSEVVTIPVSSKDQMVVIDVTKATEALGISVDDLLNMDNEYLRGLKDDGTYGEPSAAGNGLSFNLTGSFDAYGDIIVTMERNDEGNVMLVCYSNEAVADDFQVNGQFCIEVGDKLYVYYVKFVSEKIYADGIASPLSTLHSPLSSLYDLSGRKVMQPARGFYIHKGKKFVVK